MEAEQCREKIVSTLHNLAFPQNPEKRFKFLTILLLFSHPTLFVADPQTDFNKMAKKMRYTYQIVFNYEKYEQESEWLKLRTHLLQV